MWVSAGEQPTLTWQEPARDPGMRLPPDLGDSTSSQVSVAIIANNYFRNKAAFGKSELIFKFESPCNHRAHYKKSHEVEWKYSIGSNKKQFEKFRTKKYRSSLVQCCWSNSMQLSIFLIKNCIISKMGWRYEKESLKDMHWGLGGPHYKQLYHNAFPCKSVTPCSPWVQFSFYLQF